MLSVVLGFLVNAAFAGNLVVFDFHPEKRDYSNPHKEITRAFVVVKSTGGGAIEATNKKTGSPVKIKVTAEAMKNIGEVKAGDELALFGPDESYASDVILLTTVEKMGKQAP